LAISKAIFLLFSFSVSSYSLIARVVHCNRKISCVFDAMLHRQVRAARFLATPKVKVVRYQIYIIRRTMLI